MFIEYLRDIGRSLSILADEGAQRLLSGWGAPLDQLADDARLALAYGRPYECPVEAEPIDLMCASSGLPRLHGQSVEDGRAQVLQRWEITAGKGTLDGMIAQLGRLGYRATVTTQAILVDRNVFNPFGGNVGFFYVEIFTGFAAGTTWNGGGAWNDGATWDVVEPYPGAVLDIVAQIRAWKPVGTSCRYVRLAAGNSWVTVPVGEAWEYDAAGVAPDYYSFSYE